MYVLNKTTRLQAGQPWTDKNGTQHPSNWANWSKDVLEAYGIEEIQEDPRPDDRFYSVSSMGLDGKWSSVLKNLDDIKDGDEVRSIGVKTEWILKTKQTANALLAPSDWQVIAKAERDRSIDSDIATYRAAVITKCTAIEAAITSCKEMADFRKLFDTPVDSDGKATGNPPINDWPEQVS